MNKLLRQLLIRENEKKQVLYFLCLFFVIGTGMAMGRASADALFFKRFGIENLPIVYVGLSMLLALVSLVYAAYADRITAELFFLKFFLLLIILLSLTWMSIQLITGTMIYPFYYLLYEAASEILLVHAALYLSQNLDTIKAKRLTPIILAGSQLGIITGGIMVALLAPLIGTSQIILLWCLMLIIASLMILFWHKQNGQSPYFFCKHKNATLKHSIQQVKQGVIFTKNSQLLRAASMALFFMVITFYTLYYLVNRIYTDYFTTEANLTAFFGAITAINSFIGLLFQLFITNRAIEKFGIRRMNLVFPISTMLSFVGLLLLFKLPAALFGSFNKDALMPAFRNPVRNMMFNILPKNIQGRARALSVGLVLPAALVVCALFLILAQHVDHINYYLIPGLLTALLYFYYTLRMNRAYVSTLIQHLKEQVFLPDEDIFNKLRNSGAKMLSVLTDNVNGIDDKLAISCAKTLIESYPHEATEIISQRLKKSNNATADQLLTILASHTLQPFHNYLNNLDTPDIDEHLKATILLHLFIARDPIARPHLYGALLSDNPRLVTAGIQGALHYPEPKYEVLAFQRWIQLLESSLLRKLAAQPLVPLLKRIPEEYQSTLISAYHRAFLELLQSGNKHWQLTALKYMQDWRLSEFHDFSGTLQTLYANTDPEIRAAVVSCTHLLSFDHRMALLVQAFEDGHAKVRKAAMQTLWQDGSDPVIIAQHWLLNNDSYLSPRAQQSMLQHLINAGLSRDLLIDIIENKAKIARRFYDAYHVMKPYQHINSTSFLLTSTLHERVHQTVQLLLDAMEQLDEDNIIRVVKAAINSTDTRLIASACEALKNLDDNKTTELLVDVLQDNYELKKYYKSNFSDMKIALDWCKLQDEWLNTCAERVLST